LFWHALMGRLYCLILHDLLLHLTMNPKFFLLSHPFNLPRPRPSI
jgi:hypothetical protein